METMLQGRLCAAGGQARSPVGSVDPGAAESAGRHKCASELEGLFHVR
jgi:hypothetical protein